MSINLSKGQKVDLTKTNPSVKIFGVGLGWDTNNTSTGGDFDLDASAFILDANNKLLSDNHFVFYNNLKSPDGAVIHSGDNRTGQGDGDDETVSVEIAKLAAEAARINFVVTIHEAEQRRQNFGQVRNAFIRIFDKETGTEIMRFDLGEDYSVETAMTFGAIYKRDGEWRFEATGSGQQGGLKKYVEDYGLN